MFISRKLAVGKGAQAAGGPRAPTPTGRGPRKEALSSVAISEARKKDLFSLREVARIGNIETRAPQISMDKGTELSFSQNHHYRGGGSHSGDHECSTGGLGPGVGGLLPPPL